MKQYLTAAAAFFTLILLQACSGNETKTPEKAPADTAKKETAEATPAKTEPVIKPAIINIVDTISPKRLVLCIKDSAASFERISMKLGEIYGFKLGEVLKKNNLKMDGPPMAWYKSEKAPFFFEAGVPVTKKPAKLLNGAYIKEIATDSAVVAHFYGPYTLLSQGYDAIKERMKDSRKKSSAAPYEIYIGDAMDKDGNMIDPYKVRTDIVFPRH